MTNKEIRKKWIDEVPNYTSDDAYEYDNRLVSGEIKARIEFSKEYHPWGDYVIVVYDDFWMDAFSTKIQAEQFCKDMGWGV
ncbi:MAG TPA: hypothetical protein VMV58_03290, partial [Desulfosporosinus sp.]|nr:hypothetical protein [Desulfosporosinus sp.]